MSNVRIVVSQYITLNVVITLSIHRVKLSSDMRTPQQRHFYTTTLIRYYRDPTIVDYETRLFLTKLFKKTA